MPPRHGCPPADPETLDFDVREGEIHNHFLRRGDVAAHVLATSGHAPRIIVAFPAGNTGAGLWFEPGSDAIDLAIEGRVAAVERSDGMRGVSAVVTSSARALTVRGALLGSLRALRRFAKSAPLPAGMDVADVAIEPGPPLVLRRTTLDGEHHVELALAPEPGTTITITGDRIRLSAAPGASAIRATITALADDPPLTPIPAGELLEEGASADPRALRALAFLAYEEKLLAGSWRFLTYFGRDTLLSVQMLMPALRPAVIEAGLGSVIDRLSPSGEVSHEEAIGEWATAEHRRAGRDPIDPREPVHDYTMVDDDFLLAPVAAAYLLDTARGRDRAAAFLARKTPSGATYRDALAKNLAFVERRATPFAETRSADALITLLDGHLAGEWRDSVEGLGFGRAPFSVNVALVPAALEAAARLHSSPHFGCDTAPAARARRLLERWSSAADLFRVEIPEADAARLIAGYAASIGLDPAAALASIEGPVSFPALALDAAGQPIPVMSSDDGFVLLFTRPPPATLEEAARRILRPFPAGLRTQIGILVANPAFSADPVQRGLFTTAHYHGTVVWSWQQAMLAAGLRRQLDRDDLPRATRDLLEAATRALWDVIRAAEEHRNAELWSCSFEGAGAELVPFGAERGHHRDESNAVQLWSTVYLAVRP